MTYNTNPAENAAEAANVAAGAVALYRGDPFREPVVRWGGVRGETLLVNWTNGTGRVSDGLLLSPPASETGPFPGIIIPCHSCFTSAIESGVFWAAEVLAEAGYLVFVPYLGGNDIDSTIAATDYLVATPDAPTANDEFNPWWARLDRTRLGIAGHSGAGGLALNVGHIDPRYSAVVAFDPAGPGIDGLDLHTPTMVQVADYQGNTSALITPLFPDGTEVPLPLPSVHAGLPLRPQSDPRRLSHSGARFALHVLRNPARRRRGRDAGGDPGGDPHRLGAPRRRHVQHVRGDGRELLRARVVRPATSGERTDASRGARRPAPSHGDRRVRWIRRRALDRHRVLRSGPGRARAARAEAGNVPITIEGLPVCNRISFYYPTRYFLDGGSLHHEDLRAACPDADLDGFANELDNCPHVANADQLDRGGIDTTAPDGIGDACQCGDVTGNGIVNGQDANAIKRHGLGSSRTRCSRCPATAT